ncbi:MAG: AAA family ATPase [Bacteroidetes bacterium]|nr:AAA family ATPase [Bacteroidota bacterium]
MGYIHTIGLENFRAFEKQTIDFAPITVLSGDNDSGKSTIIKALQLLKHSFGAGRFPDINCLNFGEKEGVGGEFSTNAHAHDVTKPIKFVLPFSMKTFMQPLQLELCYKLQKTDPFANGHICDIAIRQSDGSLMVQISQVGSSTEWKVFVEVAFFKANLNKYMKLFRQALASKSDRVRNDFLNKYPAYFYFDNVTFRNARKIVPTTSRDHDWSFFHSRYNLYRPGYPLFRHPLIFNEEVISLFTKENQFHLPQGRPIEHDPKSSLWEAFQVIRETNSRVYQKISAHRSGQSDFSAEQIVSMLNIAEQKGLSFSDSILLQTVDVSILPRILLVKDVLFQKVSSQGLYAQYINEYIKTQQLSGENVFAAIQHLSMYNNGLQAYYDALGYPENATVLLDYIHESLLDGFSHLQKTLQHTEYFDSSVVKVSQSVHHNSAGDSLSGIVHQWLALEVEHELTWDYLFVNNWLKKSGIGNQLHVLHLGEGMYKVMIDKTNIAMLSQGNARLVQLLMKIAVSSRKNFHSEFSNYDVELDMAEFDEWYSENILIIENPEFGIDVNRQALLAEVFLDAAQQFHIQFIIETQSEVLIRGLKQLTGLGKMTPDELAIYKFHHPNRIPVGNMRVVRVPVLPEEMVSENIYFRFSDNVINWKAELMKTQNWN